MERFRDQKPTGMRWYGNRKHVKRVEYLSKRQAEQPINHDSVIRQDIWYYVC